MRQRSCRFVVGGSGAAGVLEAVAWLRHTDRETCRVSFMNDPPSEAQAAWSGALTRAEFGLAAEGR